jgi:hypothetical protein
MARLGVFSVALLCVCLAGHAETSLDLSTLTLWPQPLSAPALPLGPHERAESIAAASGESGAREDSRQGESREDLAADVAAQLEVIEAEQARGGERSAELVPTLASLASMYEKLGDHTSADAALLRAIEIARVNFGLHSLDQADVVESLVATRTTSGDYGGAAEKRRYLRELVGRNRNDPRVVAILTELAEQEMESARRLVGVPAPGQILITSGGSDGMFAPPPTPALAALHAAQSDYIGAIQAAVRTHTGNAADVFALQDALSDTIYFGFAHPEILGPGRARSAWPSSGESSWYPTLGFSGARILRHKVLDGMSFRRSPVDLAKDLLALADWYLVFGSYEGATQGMSKSYGPALDAYQMARDMLVKGNVAPETIDELLSPEVPPTLPVIPESIVGTVHDRVLRGYIDASVEITRFGDVRSMAVLGRSAGVSKGVEEQLRRYITEQTFRPRFVNGDLPRRDHFSARFYFDD